MAQGGLSVGRTTTDDCDLLLHLDNPSPLYCHTDTKLQPNIKGLATYSIKKPDMRVAMTFQSVPGPAVSANINFTNAQIRPSLGRDLSGNATQATVNVIEPGTMYGDRSNQLDVRISKLFRLSRARVAVNLDISNLVNASPVLQQNNTFAATTWQTPQRIMDGRMFKLGAQFDF